MKRTLIKILMLAWLVADAGTVMAQETNAVPALDFQSFGIISTNNIFDPTRRPRQSSRPISAPPRVDWFALVGTMSYEKGHFAFFDGTSSEYRKTLKASDTIAGYKIADIAADGIKLAASSNKTINLPVGTQMRRINGGHWVVAGRAEPGPDSSSSVASNADSSAAATPDSTQDAPPSAADNDVMKRLMLKRLQEK